MSANPLYTVRGDVPEALLDERRQQAADHAKRFEQSDYERQVVIWDEETLSCVDRLTSPNCLAARLDLFPVGHRVLAVPYRAWLPDSKKSVKRVMHIALVRYRAGGGQAEGVPAFAVAFENVANGKVRKLHVGIHLDEALARANEMISRDPDPRGWRPFKRSKPTLTRRMFLEALEGQLRELSG